MNRQPQAKMFLADERGCNETDWFRSYNTFNADNYYNEHKQPFTDLYVLSEQTIAAGHHLAMEVGECSIIFILPVVGNISFKNGHIGRRHLSPGQLQACYMQTGSFEVANPYEHELVSFLQLRVRTTMPGANKAELFNFDLNENQNNLIALTTHAPQFPLVSIGKFTGRKEAVYNIKNNNSLFVFIIQGAFEVQGRLLHAKDGLGLQNEGEIELEALSNEAIILLIEMN